MTTASQRRARPTVEVLEDRTVPATFNVTSLADAGAGSLRDCIQQANTLAGFDTIVFDVQGTIGLDSALPDITDGLLLSGSGAGSLRLRRSAGASSEFTLLRVVDTTLVVEGLTLSDNASTGPTLTPTGIEATGDSGLTVVDCTFENFTCGYGAVILVNGCSADFTGCTFRNNTGSFFEQRGVIHNFGGSLFIDSSTFHANAMGTGGCVFTESNLSSSAYSSLTNCTFTGNSSSIAAVVNLASGNDSTVDVTHCTIAGNLSFGVSTKTDSYTGTLNLRGNLLANNASGNFRNVGPGLINSLGNNVSTGPDSSILNQASDFSGGNVLLGPLRGNGGSVATKALLPGSAGLDMLDGQSIEADARGSARPQGAGPDAGAYEAGEFLLDESEGNFQVVQAGNALPLPLRVRLTEGGNPVEGILVTFTADAGLQFANGTQTFQATTDADGFATAGSLVTGDVPGGFTVLAEITGVQAAFTVQVVNFSPQFTSLTLSTQESGEGDAESVLEGQLLTLSGTFADPGDGRAHWLFVSWGEDSQGEGESGQESLTDSVLIPAGQTSFSVTHIYTAAGGLSSEVPAFMPIFVSLQDASGAGDFTFRSILVEDNVPIVDAGDDLFANEGTPFTRTGSFSYGGDNSFIAEVDYGDGGGWEPLQVEGRTFVLSHTYVVEGSYTVRVRVSDGRGEAGEDSFSADVMLPDVVDADKGKVGPGGGTVTVSVTGGTATLYKAAGGGTTAIIIARVPETIADSQDGVPTFGGKTIGGAFDIRALNVGPNDFVLVVLEYANDDYDIPILSYFDRARGIEVLVPLSSYTVDPIARKIYFRLDSHSTPALQALTGTVFTITVPISDNGPGIPTASYTVAASAALAAMISMVDTGGGGLSIGPGGGNREQYDEAMGEAVTGGPAEDREDVRRARAALAAATDGLPAAPEAGVSLPAAAMTAPEPRRIEIVPMAPPPGGSEEEQEQEECVAPEVSPRDEAFVEMGEGARRAGAFMMLPALLAAGRRWRGRREAVHAAPARPECP